MKKLFIVRHAKSSWDYPHLEDDQRPLLEKGKKRTKLVIDYLLDNNVNVDLIVSSHAVRALETARILAHALQYPMERIEVHKNFYYYDKDGLFNIFFDMPDEVNSIMIVGHNPTLTNFANHFLSRKIDWLPTSGIISLKFDAGKWTDIPTAKSSLDFYITPRMMKDKKKRNMN